MKEEVSLPDNAFRPLKEGEEYEPLMKPNKQYREVNSMVYCVGTAHGRNILCCHSILRP